MVTRFTSCSYAAADIKVYLYFETVIEKAGIRYTAAGVCCGFLFYKNSFGISYEIKTLRGNTLM